MYFTFQAGLFFQYSIMNDGEKILILGMGNDILMDDGIGPRLVHDLSEMNIIQRSGLMSHVAEDLR